MKSFRPKDPPDDGDPGGGHNASADFKGQMRSNESHRSTTNPDAIRKRIEEIFGWMKTVAGLRKTSSGALLRSTGPSSSRLGAYNLVRIPKLIRAAS